MSECCFPGVEKFGLGSWRTNGDIATSLMKVGSDPSHAPARGAEAVVADEDVHAGRGEGAPRRGEGMVARDVDDDVVALGALGEVVLGVVDDVVGADRSDHLELARRIHAGHVRAVGLGELDGEDADAPAGAVDEHGLARSHLAVVADTAKRDQAGGRHGRGLLEGEVGRLRPQRACGDRRVLGERAAVAPLVALQALTEHVVTAREPGHVASDRRDAAGDIRPGDAASRSP